MKKLPYLLFGALVLAGNAFGQTTATTTPVGFITNTCKSGSDTYISPGLNQAVAFSSSVLTLPATNQIQVTGAPAWTANQFAGAYFVKFTSGAKAGAYFVITSNTSDTLTVNLSADSITTALASDTVQIFPFWTLSSLFPIGNSAITQSLGTSGLQRRTQVLFPDITNAGTNLAATGIYYQTSTGWKDALNNNAVADNIVIPPDSYIIIRNRAADADTTFTAVGLVDLTPLVSELVTTSTAAQDNSIALNRPVDVALKNLNLISSNGFVASNGTGGLARRDLILTFDNTIADTNKPANHIYYYDSTSPGNWKDALDSNRISDDDVIKAGTGFIIRKYRTGNGATAFWTNTTF